MSFPHIEKTITFDDETGILTEEVTGGYRVNIDKKTGSWRKIHGCWVCPNCTERFSDKLTEILATREIRLPPHCPKCGVRVK